jgi:hypothetical protein
MPFQSRLFSFGLLCTTRLSTSDLLLTWGYTGDSKCVFCHSVIESRDHLFFSCSFSSRIWKTCMQRYYPFVLSTDWHAVISEGCSRWKTKALMGVLCRLILSSTVYGIWHARNAIKHSGQPKTEEQILKSIFWQVRSRISGKEKFKKNAENIRICHCWNLDSNLLV